MSNCFYYILRRINFYILKKVTLLLRIYYNFVYIIISQIAVAMAAVLGVVLYRMSVLTVLSAYGHPMVTSYAILFTTATAASINLCCIILFNWLYVWLAEYLTEVIFHENLFIYKRNNTEIFSKL